MKEALESTGLKVFGGENAPLPVGEGAGRGKLVEIL